MLDRAFIRDWVVRLGVVAAAGAGLLVFSDAWGLTPRFVRERPVEVGVLALVLVVMVARWRGARWVEGWDRNAEMGLGRGLPWVGLAVCVGMLGIWVPTYLTRPWFRDVDAFASLAIGWDRGILPYRDVRAYNAPGHIYLCWILGRVFGWGRTVPYQAVDLGIFVALLATVWGWSGRRLGGRLPGVAAMAGLIGVYITFNYMMIPERDWQAAALGGMGMMWIDGWRGRRAVVAAALAMAVGVVIRPHGLLLLPAMEAAVAGSAGGGSAWRRWWVEGLVWCGVSLLGVLVLLSPLLVQGLMDDWLRGLAVAGYGGPYAKKGLAEMAGSVMGDLRVGWGGVGLAVCVAAALVGPRELRGVGRMLGLAIGGAIVWKAVHPTGHVYLSTPKELFVMLAVAVPVRWVMSLGRMGWTERYALIMLLLFWVCPRVPDNLTVGSVGDAVGALARGRAPDRPPNGCEIGFRDGGRDRGIDRWLEYQSVLTYLRRHTSPTTAVANLLGQFPYLSINGPAGRVDPFRAESGIGWMVLVDQDLDAEFARDLERAGGDVVVVWSPREKVEARLALPRVRETVRERFEVEAVFGRYEVWRRLKD